MVASFFISYQESTSVLVAPHPNLHLVISGWKICHCGFNLHCPHDEWWLSIFSYVSCPFLYFICEIPVPHSYPLPPSQTIPHNWAIQSFNFLKTWFTSILFFLDRYAGNIFLQCVAYICLDKHKFKLFYKLLIYFLFYH